MNTKLQAVTDAIGRPITFFLSAGQVSDHSGAAALSSLRSGHIALQDLESPPPSPKSNLLWHFFDLIGSEATRSNATGQLPDNMPDWRLTHGAAGCPSAPIIIAVAITARQSPVRIKPGK